MNILGARHFCSQNLNCGFITAIPPRTQVAEAIGITQREKTDEGFFFLSTTGFSSLNSAPDDRQTENIGIQTD